LEEPNLESANRKVMYVREPLVPHSERMYVANASWGQMAATVQ